MFHLYQKGDLKDKVHQSCVHWIIFNLGVSENYTFIISSQYFITRHLDIYLVYRIMDLLKGPWAIGDFSVQ